MTPSHPRPARGAGRRALVALLALGLVAAACGDSSSDGDADRTTRGGRPAEAAVEPVERWQARGRWLVDQTGRTVIPRGLQVVHAEDGSFLLPPDMIGPEDADLMRSWGFNAIRLTWAWRGIEPEPGRYDPQYGKDLAEMISMFQSRGIAVHLMASADQGWGYTNDFAESDQVQGPFPLLDPVMLKNYETFYTGEDADGNEDWRTDAFVKAWGLIAEAVADDPPRLGYDLYNEPQPAQSSCLGDEGCPEGDAWLYAYEDRLADAIRAHDTTSVIWYEPQVMFNTANPTHIGPIDESRLPAGFAFHSYCNSSPITSATPETLAACIDEVMDNGAAAAEDAGGIPYVMNEMGGSGQSQELITTIADSVDAHAAGWFYWGYKDHDTIIFSDNRDNSTADPDWVRTISRPFPQATAGTPGPYAFDPATRTFTYRFEPDAAVEADTEIFTAPVHYPDGYEVEVTGATVVSEPDADVLLLRLGDDPPATVTVTLTPRG